MPYPRDHKTRTRARIIESARVLFNRHGYGNITIRMVMAEAGLTPGGFYAHFKSKEELFAAAVSSFLMGRGAQWRADAGIDPERPTKDAAMQMLRSYLSDQHLGDIDGQCPMIALPSDVNRATGEAQASYQQLLEAMVALFEGSLKGTAKQKRATALALAALSVGGMVLARAMPASALAAAVRAAALARSKLLIGEAVRPSRRRGRA